MRRASSPIQNVSSVEESQVHVREPVRILDASQKVVVSQGVGTIQDFSLGPGQDHWGPRDHTLVLRRETSDLTLADTGERQNPTNASIVS